MRLLIAAAFMVCLFGSGVSAAADRIALVIGNGAYAHVPKLANPLNDAHDVGAALAASGFEVTTLENADYDTMRRSLAQFGEDASKSEVAVIYFAGHGAEVDRFNYLIPVDASIKDPRDLVFNGVPLDLMRQAALPAKTLGLVIIDACRDNPFVAQMTLNGRSMSNGLARVRARGQNQLVAFSAKEGTIAEDGEGRNSPYAKALTKALREPGLEIGKLFRRVRDEVLRTTSGSQEPALYGSLSEADFYFVPPEVKEPEIAKVEAPDKVALAAPVAPRSGGRNAGPAIAPGPDPTLDVAFWTAISNSSDVRDFEDYLQRFPDGIFGGIAQRRIEQIRHAEALAASSAQKPNPNRPASIEDRLAALPTVAPDPAERRRPVVREQDLTLKPLPPAPEAQTEPRASAIPIQPTRRQIRDLQARLTLLGFNVGPVDGLFGQRTGAALSTYQRRVGMEPDGRVSEAVLASLSKDVPEPELTGYYARTESERRRQDRERQRRQNAAPPVQTARERVPEAATTVVSREPAADEETTVDTEPQNTKPEDTALTTTKLARPVDPVEQSEALTPADVTAVTAPTISVPGASSADSAASAPISDADEAEKRRLCRWYQRTQNRISPDCERYL
ncbi:MAG: caspase family protein [Pseudomonadota bacterium]